MSEGLSELEAAPCGLMQTDDDGMFLRSNGVFARWLGVAPEQLVGKRRLQDLLTMGGRIFHQTHWAPLLRMQGSLSEVKLELVHADGRPVPFLLNASRRERDGRFVHDIAAFVAHDRDRYEQELVRSRRRVEELHAVTRDRAQLAEQMIGIVSHDLRSPLGTVKIAGEMLASSGADALPKAVPRIARAVERAERLIADLLDFTQARLGAGLAVAIAPTDVHRTVGVIVADLQGTYPAQTLVHVSEGPGEVELDESRVGQAIGNLVANAVAYGRSGAPITVLSSVTETTCTVSVHNEGDAIPPAIAKTIFAPMTRGTTAGSKAHSVGLGLFIVQEIAKAHRGKASVISTSERGTTFTIALPRTQATTSERG